MHTLILHPALIRPTKPGQSLSHLKPKPFYKYTFEYASNNKLRRRTLSPKCLSETQRAVAAEGPAPDQASPFTEWPQILQISVKSRSLLLGQAIHVFLVKLGAQNDTFQGNNLVNLYAEFSRLGDAQRVFDEMPVRNAITWTSLMKGYSKIDDVESLFLIARQMLSSGESFNAHTCSVMLEACNSREQGEQIHAFVIKVGFKENVFVATSLVSVYSRSGSPVEAGRVFDDISEPDARCFNVVISEYANAGLGEKAIQSFVNMLNSGLEPSMYTFTGVISACDKELGFEKARQLHGLVTKHSFACEASVGNALISMHGKHGKVEEAEKVFFSMDERNLISWTALISGYVKNGHSLKALHAFSEIRGLGIDIDSSCASVVLNGCTQCKNLEFGRQVHAFLMKSNRQGDVNVGTALIDLYAKRSRLRSAKLVFNGLSSRNTASFNAILGGFLKTNGNEKEDAITMFSQLRLGGLVLDAVTFALLLSLSADQASLVRGNSLHAYAIKMGLAGTLAVGNAVITMYAKCGCIKDSYQMFEVMDRHDTASWNMMISGFAYGQGGSAIMLFEEMEKEGIFPDGVTILSILQACNHSGLWEHGIGIFDEMKAKYGIKPVFEHYACMVGLLGGSRHFERAVDLINSSPFPESTLLWRILFDACKLHQEKSFGSPA